MPRSTSDSGVPATRRDDQIPLMFRLLLLAVEEQTVCTRYDGNRERRLARPRLPARRPRRCPRSTRATTISTIVPAAPIERLVTYSGTGGGA